MYSILCPYRERKNGCEVTKIPPKTIRLTYILNNILYICSPNYREYHTPHQLDRIERQAAVHGL